MDVLWVRATVTAALGLVFVGSAAFQDELSDPVSFLLVVANCAPLLWVHRHPLVVVLIFAVTYPLWLAFPTSEVAREGHVLQSLPTLVAMYMTGASPGPTGVKVWGLVTPTWMLGAAAFGLWDARVDEIVYVASVMVFAWGLGLVDSRRKAHAKELEIRTRQLAEAQHALAARAVNEDRARIARELHDVIAHAMSVITIQAGVGGHLMARQPDQARNALDVIERTGREALAEMRRMLVVLRPGDEPLPDSVPGLNGVDQLIANARATGLHVTFTQRGEVPRLAPGLDLTAYRVLQEGLTNAAKHAPGSRVEVWVQCQHGLLQLRVRDHGPGARTAYQRGQGLNGMTDRVRLYDGDLTIITDSSGFDVRVTLPVDGMALP